MAMKKSILDEIILNIEGNPWTVRDACTGCIVFGMTGSGKSSGPLYKIAHKFLTLGYGGVVFCAKPDEADTWKKYAAKAHLDDDPRKPNRTGDLLFLSQLTFNYLDSEAKRAGRGGGQVENLVNLYLEIVNMGKDKRNSGGGNEEYWNNAVKQLLRNSITILQMAQQPINIENIHEVIVSAPSASSETVEEKGYCSNLLDVVIPREFCDTPEYQIAHTFFYEEFAYLDERTRSNTISSFSVAADSMQRGELARCFSAEHSTLQLEDLYRKGKILLSDMDYTSWGQYLRKDLETLDWLLVLLQDITPEHDGKLRQLKADLTQKFTHPINRTNKKVLIFTAFSDTAIYLYENLAPFIQEKFELNTALITGDVEARSTLKLKARQKLDFNTVLTLFSPTSKEKASIYPNVDGEIDVLIATDCISEGQNLQDCDYLVNFDIHWNPVRIIQRFGRIDRIGSPNECIQMVNYWPDMTLDEYINLKGRVEARMKVSVLTATGDDNPLTTEEQNDLDYRKEQLQRLQHEVIDLEDMNTGVSIIDLGLNEFRLDLLAYMKENPDVEHTPNGLHAVVHGSKGTPDGVIFVLKARKDTLPLDMKNRLHPFYLVYIATDGHVVINHLSPKELLDRFRLLCKGKPKSDKDACTAFNKETKDGLNMTRYSKLLNQAIESIVQTKDASDMDNFLNGVQADLFSGHKVMPDDFVLIDFLVVKGGQSIC